MKFPSWVPLCLFLPSRYYNIYIEVKIFLTRYLLRFNSPLAFLIDSDGAHSFSSARDSELI